MTAGSGAGPRRPARGVPAPAAAQRRMPGDRKAGACRPHRRNRIDREVFQADRDGASKGIAEIDPGDLDD